MGEPQMRASNYLNAMKLLRQLPMATSAAVLQKMNPDDVAQLENANSMGWVPARHFMPLHRALHSTLTGDAFAQFWKRNADLTLQHPLLRGPMQFMAKLTGIGPKSIVKSIQNSWTLLAKDVGRMLPKDTSSETRMEILWEGIPDELAREPSFYGSFGPGFQSAFDLLKMPMVISLSVNASTRSGVFAFDWKK